MGIYLDAHFLWLLIINHSYYNGLLQQPVITSWRLSSQKLLAEYYSE